MDRGIYDAKYYGGGGVMAAGGILTFSGRKKWQKNDLNSSFWVIYSKNIIFFFCLIFQLYFYQNKYSFVQLCIGYPAPGFSCHPQSGRFSES